MTTQHTSPPQSDTVAHSTILSVAEVIAIVREWVENHARHMPDFAGAYLWGGITAMAEDAPFHLYRDVDVVVVMTQGAPEDEWEEFYRGLCLEIIPKNLDEHRDIEAVLGNPSAGPNMAMTQILADPTGLLEPLCLAVTTDYTRRRWVAARCNTEKTWAENALNSMRQAATPQDRLNAARDFLSAISGLLAVAQLKRPTTRRTLALLRELLEAQGRPDLNEMALTVMGSVHMSRAEVEALLDQTMIAFDRAVEVIHTPIPYGFAIRPHLRPYYLEGSREMIDEGSHREAMFWITIQDTAYLALQHDAPEAEKPIFAAHFQAMCAALGYTSDDLWAERVKVAEHLASESYRMADALVALHPE